MRGEESASKRASVCMGLTTNSHAIEHVANFMAKKNLVHGRNHACVCV